MYEKQTLPNGVRIVYEHMPHVRSAAIGVWVGVGSRYESPCEAGSAHFIEHMLFKGTAQHSASELAERMDAIGGQVNAYTTREGTCYYARVLDEHLDRAATCSPRCSSHRTFPRRTQITNAASSARRWTCTPTRRRIWSRSGSSAPPSPARWGGRCSDARPRSTG